MAMLPQLASSECFGLRSQNSRYYLQCVHRKEGGNRIEANADALIENMRARFFVEPWGEDPGYVHVRCCYNNKYWVPLEVQEPGAHGRRPSSSSSWIIGTTDEPDEDTSSPHCTLFRPERFETNETIRV